MRNARWPVLIIAAVAIGLLISFFIQPSEPEAPASGPAMRLAPAAAVQSRHAAAPVSPRTAGAVHLPTAAMRQRFETAENYAAFIQDAMQRPQEGGRFYAWLAYVRCGEVARAKVRGGDAGNPVYQTAVRVIGELQRRCRDVGAYFPDERALIAALRHSNARGYPDALMNERGALVPSSRETSVADLQRAYASNDPYLIAATLETNIDFFAESLGEEFRSGEERPLLYMAMSAAACEIAGNCADSYHALLPCLHGAGCEFSDYRDYVRATVPPESRELFDKTRNRLLLIARERAIPQVQN
jgi:hypothetical protein